MRKLILFGIVALALGAWLGRTAPVAVAAPAASAEQIVEELKLREALSLRRTGRELTEAQRDGLHNPFLSKELPELERLASASELSGVSDADLVQRLTGGGKGIYGRDNRTDLYVLADTFADDPFFQKVQERARSVALVTSLDMVSIPRPGTVQVAYAKYGDPMMGMPMCETERFYGQPEGGFCTGFVVGPDLIATAGHCVDGGPPEALVFVFGFQMQDQNRPPGQDYPIEDVYQGVEIVGGRFDPDSDRGEDWAVVRVDRPIAGRAPLPVRSAGAVAPGDEVYVLGHPSGLPMKYAGTAPVRADGNSTYFVTPLDTYGGNSGSPVFNARDHVVEGILVRGDEDFAPVMVGDGGEVCVQSVMIGETEGRGEDVTRSTLFCELLR